METVNNERITPGLSQWGNCKYCQFILRLRPRENITQKIDRILEIKYHSDDCSYLNGISLIKVTFIWKYFKFQLEILINRSIHYFVLSRDLHVFIPLPHFYHFYRRKGRASIILVQHFNNLELAWLFSGSIFYDLWTGCRLVLQMIGEINEDEHVISTFSSRDM